jgi:hypothetical protein
VTDPLSRALDELVPGSAGERGDWEKVLAAAGLRSTPTAPDGRPRRLTRRRALIGGIVAAALAVITATPAFGLRNLIVNLVGGRTSVSFNSSRPAPPAIKKMFLDMALDAPRGMSPHVLPDEARQIVFRGAAGRRRVLWVAPSRGGGFCSILDGAGGGCISPASERIAGPLELDGSYAWRVGQQPRIFEIAGHVFSPNVATLQLVFQDHTTAQLPFVYVSRPINAGFFIAGIPSQHQQKGHWPTTVIARDKHGAIVTANPIQPPTQPLRPIVRPTRQPPRPLPTAASVEPTSPTQTGTADGVTAIVGANGQVRLTTSRLPDQVARLLTGQVSISCFRLTHEYGIFTVRGDGTSGRFSDSIGFGLNNVGRVDGCEIETGRGHRWPDKLDSHSPVEIALTPTGRAYFENRAAARDLALFVRSRNMQQLRKEPAARAKRDIRHTYRQDLAHSPIKLALLNPATLRFSEKSKAGKTFTVTVHHGRISHENLKPYAFVF